MTEKTIGLIGGMSWESTALYYKLINQHVGERLGNLHSASILMYSYDFEPIKVLQYAERWDLAGDDLARTAQRLPQRRCQPRRAPWPRAPAHRLAPPHRARLGELPHDG